MTLDETLAIIADSDSEPELEEDDELGSDSDYENTLYDDVHSMHGSDRGFEWGEDDDSQGPVAEAMDMTDNSDNSDQSGNESAFSNNLFLKV